MHKSIIFITLLFFTITAIAEPITGTVYEKKDDLELPLPFANVYWKNTTIGTTTDENGNFTLRRTSKSDTLVASFTGYFTQETKVEKGNYVKFLLSSDVELSEVTVFQKSKAAVFDLLTPIATEKLTGAELHKAACCNLSESFETNPSVDVAYADATTGAKQIKLLGLAGIYSQYQTDNMPNLKGLATNYALTYIPGSWMESISISKGAASVQNGPESITGQLNVEYKKPDSKERLYLNAFSTLDGFMEGNAITNIHLNESLSTNILAYVGKQSKRIDENNDGFMDTPLKTNFHVMNRWKFQKENLMMQAGVNLLKEDLTAGQTDFKRGMEQIASAPYGIQIDAKRMETFLKGGYVFTPSTSVAFLSNYTRHEMDSFYGKQNYNGKEDNFYARMVLSHVLDTHDHDHDEDHEGHDHDEDGHEGEESSCDEKEGQHTINAGMSFVANQIEEDYATGMGIPKALLKEERVPGIFAEYTYKPTDNLTLLAGIRADFHNLFGTFYTPRLHLRYSPFNFLTLRASAGRGYRTANLLSENSHLLASARTLDLNSNYYQEKAWNYGFSALNKFQVNNRELQVTLEYYRTDFSDQMIVDLENSSNQVLFYGLDGKSFANSAQLDVRYELFRNFDLTAAYRINDVKQTIGGKLLEKPLTSKYKGLVSVNYATNLKKWMFDYTVQFNGGGRIPLTPNVADQYLTPERFDPFTVMNAQVTRYFRNWNIYIGSENFLDYKQDNPIVSAQNPYGDWFDATKVYAPVVGRRIYAGLRFSLSRD